MNKPLVLIADDDRELVQALARRCRALGLRVATATDAVSAWQQVVTCPPDAAIVDVQMPPGNGLCVTEMMATHDTLRHVPVIMLTGQTDPATVRRCHDLLAYYVTKCDDVWPRIEPLLHQLLMPPTDPPASDVAAMPSDRCAAARRCLSHRLTVCRGLVQRSSCVRRHG